jgi:hypothetical protein
VRQLLEQIVPLTWDSGKPKPGSGFSRVKFLQSISDLFDRPINNRLSASTSATAVAANAAVQSTGVGTSQQQPKRYAEFTIKARVTFNVNSAGPAFVYVYRTLGAIPANGAAPNAGDVIVGGDAFLGGPTLNGVNQCGAFSFLDTGLDVTKQYRYYLAVKGPNGNTLNLVNSSQLLVMERS